MADEYDSDSGHSDASSVTRTNVLLASIEPKLKVNTGTHTSSFAGGYPTFPSLPSSCSSIPTETGIICGHCGAPMPLLSQIYCPMEQGENDRTLYVWACPKADCQRRAGSVRAFRASARNEIYAADAAEKRAKAEQEAKRRAEEDERKAQAAKVNPFALGGTTSGPDAGLGNALFGSAGSFGASDTASANPFSTVASAVTDAFSSLNITGSSSSTQTTTKPVAAGPETPATTFAPPLPAYIPAQAIDSYPEDIPKSTAADNAPQKGLADDDVDEDEDGKSGKKSGGAASVAEQWEKVLPRGMDEVFERFVNRLNAAIDGNEQVLRYDLGGVPLPYSEKSDLYKQLFPPKSNVGKHVPVVQNNAQRADGDDEDEDDENSYVKRYTPYPTVPVCPHCKSRRVFEVQLVSSMISYLSPERLSTTGKAPSKKSKKSSATTLEERKKEVEALLQGKTVADGAEVDKAQQGVGMGMEWGSVVVFGCEGDCVGFTEEWVGVEWEDDQ